MALDNSERLLLILEAAEEVPAAVTATDVSTTAVAVATTVSTQTTPYGFTTSAQADALVAQVNALVADNLAKTTAINDLIDDVAALRAYLVTINTAATTA